MALLPFGPPNVVLRRPHREGAVPAETILGARDGPFGVFYAPAEDPLYDRRVSVALFSVTVLLLCLATHRVTRFVTRDKLPLICAPRDAFVERWGVYVDTPRQERKVSINGHDTNIFMRSLAYAWECDWCTSIWVGAGLTYLTWRWHDTMIWVLTALAASCVAGLIATVEPSDTPTGR